MSAKVQPVGIISSRFTKRDKMGSLIPSSKKNIERTKHNEDAELYERRSSRSLKQVATESRGSLNSLPYEDDVIQNSTSKRKPSSHSFNEEKLNKKQKSNHRSQNLIANETTSEPNKTPERSKNKNENKKRKQKVFWESKLTGARRVSKRLSKLQLKNKLARSQTTSLPTKVYIHLTGKNIRQHKEGTFEKTISKARLGLSKSVANKTVARNKFIVTSKASDQEVEKDDEVIICFGSKKIEPNYRCVYSLKDPVISIEKTEIVDNDKTTIISSQINEVCQENSVKILDTRSGQNEDKKINDNINLPIHSEEVTIVNRAVGVELAHIQSEVAAEIGSEADKLDQETSLAEELSEAKTSKELLSEDSLNVQTSITKDGNTLSASFEVEDSEVIEITIAGISNDESTILVRSVEETQSVDEASPESEPKEKSNVSEELSENI